MYNVEELKILIKKITGFNARNTKKLIIPYLKTLQGALKDSDIVIHAEAGCFCGAKPCLFILLQDRILYITNGIKTVHELYIENIASFQKEQTGTKCTIKISDAGNTTYKFDFFAPADIDIIIDFLQKKEIDIDEVVKKKNGLPLNIENYNKTLWLCACGGFIGLHRFYAGHTWTPLVQIVLLFLSPFLLFVWWLADLIIILINKFKTVDGFLLLPNLSQARFYSIAAFVVLNFLLFSFFSKFSYLWCDDKNFSIAELEKAANTLKTYPGDLKKITPDVFWYSQYKGVKNQYRYGFFKLPQGTQDGVAIYSNYGVVCDCSNKSLTPFWQELRNEQNNNSQEFNYIKDKELTKVNPDERQTHKTMWQVLCQ